MSNFWEEQFNECPEAEGIDFVNIFATPWNPGVIYDSKTKEQMITGCAYPRSGYLYWKMVDGEKQYIITEKFKRKPGSMTHHPEQTELWIVEDASEEELVGAFEDRAEAEEMCLAFYEEAAYLTALEQYQGHHHWTMKRACEFGWIYHKLDFWVKPVNLWKFFP